VKDLVIIDSGGANIASLVFALERLGCAAHLSADPAEIRGAARVILPGVGAAADAMARLRAHGLVDVIPKLTQPLLGICLGMQLLFESSEEGDTRCLGVFPGAVRRFAPAPDRPVPHMGWNSLHAVADVPLLSGIGNGAYAYFVHSYAAPVGPYTLARCDYGADFSAVAGRGNFLATQFHPERSAAVGARILANFLELS
jgi:imidazole glycerol-phosphate synthase subunit HisH